MLYIKTCCKTTRVNNHRGKPKMRKTVKKAAIKKKAATKKKAVTKKAATKKTVRKAVAKKKTVKKAAAKKKTVAKAVVKKAAIKRVSKQYTKSELMNAIAEHSEVGKKEVIAIFDTLSDIIEAHVKKGAIGQFTLPGLMKVKTIRKPATKKRKGINPFTGEETIFQAKPARTAVKILPLKKLKEMV
ncbi:HU family DNA-binding protein [Pseudomonadota bacterium]